MISSNLERIKATIAETARRCGRDPAEIKIDMPVEMVFRILRYVGGFYTYWWKARPKRD